MPRSTECGHLLFIVPALPSDQLKLVIAEFKNAGYVLDNFTESEAFPTKATMCDISSESHDQIAMTSFLRDQEDRHQCNFWIKPNSIDRSKPFLFIFDLDSTLVRLETIDELAKFAGVEQEIKVITKRAMEGKQDFEEALKIRSKLLAGLDADDCWQRITMDLEFMPGAHLISKHFPPGSKTAIVSGGFMPVAEVVRQRLAMDFCFANTLLTDPSGKFNGELCDSLIVTPAKKREIMLELASQYEIPPSNIVAMGDGANDLQMLAAAGIGIAYNGKPVVRASAQYRLDSPDLTSILYLC